MILINNLFIMIMEYKFDLIIGYSVTIIIKENQIYSLIGITPFENICFET